MSGVLDSWLLNFIISVQWRVLISTPSNQKNISYIESFELAWRQFLLGARADTGNCESHMIFLGKLPVATESLGRNINTYTLRSVDATTVSSEKKNFGVYSKIGPIVLFTSIFPSKLKGNFDSRIRRRGVIRVGQKLKNTYLNRFILITRPNEIFPRMLLSGRQNAKIAKDIIKNPQKNLNSLSFHAFESDILMKNTQDRSSS